MLSLNVDGTKWQSVEHICSQRGFSSPIVARALVRVPLQISFGTFPTFRGIPKLFATPSDRNYLCFQLLTIGTQFAFNSGWTKARSKKMRTHYEC